MQHTSEESLNKKQNGLFSHIVAKAHMFVPCTPQSNMSPSTVRPPRLVANSAYPVSGPGVIHRDGDGQINKQSLHTMIEKDVLWLHMALSLYNPRVPQDYSGSYKILQTPIGFFYRALQSLSQNV